MVDQISGALVGVAFFWALFGTYACVFAAWEIRTGRAASDRAMQYATDLGDCQRALLAVDRDKKHFANVVGNFLRGYSYANGDDPDRVLALVGMATSQTPAVVAPAVQEQLVAAQKAGAGAKATCARLEAN